MNISVNNKLFVVGNYCTNHSILLRKKMFDSQAKTYSQQNAKKVNRHIRKGEFLRGHDCKRSQD